MVLRYNAFHVRKTALCIFPSKHFNRRLIMRLCIFFLISMPLFLHAFTVSQHKLWKKINSPLPSWMEEQIEEDLSHFKESGVTKEMLDKTMSDVYAIPTGSGAQFVRYKIQNNRISFETRSENPSDIRIVDFVRFVNLLARYTELPDIEFIVSLWDSYDRPIFLENTHCPIFTMCRLKHNPIGVLFPEVRFFEGREGIFNDVERASNDTPWAKKHDKAYWKGGTTGGYYPPLLWDYKPRSRLVLFSKEHPDLIDACFTYPYWIDENLKMTLENYGLFGKWAKQVEGVGYKYLISVDGNTFASSFWWQLVSNCTVVKSDSDYIEWFYKGVKPFVHYVPYKPDCSDLEERLNWLKSHDKEAEKIAKNATQFAEENLTTEDMLLYFYAVFHAYAKLQWLPQ